jgi:FkbM family methyltransferase
MTAASRHKVTIAADCATEHHGQDRTMPVDETLIVATVHGVEIPAAPFFGPGKIAALNSGRYERHEVACGLAAIPPGARILELGAGSGVVGAVLARNCKPAAVLSVEANPDLLAHIERLYRHNGLTDTISVRHGAILSAPNAPATVEFFISRNFLGSGLRPGNNGRRRAVQVPVVRYQELKAAFPHDTIMMDIEGAELDFLRHADLTGVNVIVAEMHRRIFGREGMRECRRLLQAAGLRLDVALSKARVHVYRRV